MAMGRTSYDSFFKPQLEKQAEKKFWQAIVDEDIHHIDKILKWYPHFLISIPDHLQILSKKTWQLFNITETPLTFCSRRSQVEMIENLFSCASKLDMQEAAHKSWNFFFITKDEKDSYFKMLKGLIDIISEEDFLHGTPETRLVDRIGEKTKLALEILRSALMPEEGINLKYFYDIEQLLVVSYELYLAHFNDFKTWDQRDLYCISVHGLIEGLQTPEMAQKYCFSLQKYFALELSNNLALPDWAKACFLANGTSFYRPSKEAVTGLGYDTFIGLKGEQFQPNQIQKLQFHHQTFKHLKNLIENRYDKFAEQYGKLQTNSPAYKN